MIIFSRSSVIATRIQMNRTLGGGEEKEREGEEGERGKKEEGRKRRAGQGEEQEKGNFSRLIMKRNIIFSFQNAFIDVYLFICCSYT